MSCGVLFYCTSQTASQQHAQCLLNNAYHGVLLSQANSLTICWTRTKLQFAVYSIVMATNKATLCIIRRELTRSFRAYFHAMHPRGRRRASPVTYSAHASLVVVGPRLNGTIDGDLWCFGVLLVMCRLHIHVTSWHVSKVKNRPVRRHKRRSAFRVSGRGIKARRFRFGSNGKLLTEIGRFTFLVDSVRLDTVEVESRLCRGWVSCRAMDVTLHRSCCVCVCLCVQ